jgi:hypothetical protein
MLVQKAIINHFWSGKARLKIGCSEHNFCHSIETNVTYKCNYFQGNQILANISPDEYSRIIKVLEDASLSTDLAGYCRYSITSD